MRRVPYYERILREWLMLRLMIALMFGLAFAGCDDGAEEGPPPGEVIEGEIPCAPTATRCAAETVEVCIDEVWVDQAACADGQTCQDGACTLVCMPDCAGRACGSDGCDGVCGECAGQESCSTDGECQAPGPACGDDVCNGDETCATCAVDCGNCCGNGTCEAAETCVNCAADCGCGADVCDAQTEQCVGCTPQCDGRECGDDGCGGTCGACDGAACTDGLCDGVCVPSCDGRSCGDDGCEGECGACDADQVCDAAGACVAPPEACGDGQCGAGEDCSTCAQDCGDCCGDGRCADVENCASCAADCACADGEDCAPDRRECVPVCVPQCDGRNCGGDGCGGECGACADAQACEAGVCVDVCQPDCTDRVCGGDGCMGRCGECDANALCNDGLCEEICQPMCVDRQCGLDGCGGVCGECADDGVCGPDGSCLAPFVVDAPGVYPRQGSSDQGRLLLAEPQVVVLLLRVPNGRCPAPNSLILEDQDGGRLHIESEERQGACPQFSIALAAGEYAILVDFTTDEPLNYELTAEFWPIRETIDAPGVYGRAAQNGIGEFTIRVDEPMVFTAIPGGPNVSLCPYGATAELTQGDQLLANAVSLRNAQRCGRILAFLEPGEYRLRFFSDKAPIPAFVVQFAMTPAGPNVLDDDAVIGRPGAPIGQSDVITLQIDGPSIVRYRIDGGMGRCIEHRANRDGPVHPALRDQCSAFASQFPHPGGELTLHLRALIGLSPYVLHYDIEAIPTGNSSLPRSSVLGEVEEDFIFVQLDVPSRVDFALEVAPGQACDVNVTRQRFDGYSRVGAQDRGFCTWSTVLDPGVHGYSYFGTVAPRGLPYNRRVTVTPLDGNIPGPGVYSLPDADEVEVLDFVLDAPQAVRISVDPFGPTTCARYDFAVVLEDGRRIEPEDHAERCDVVTALLPAGNHHFERQGLATDFRFEFGDIFDGSGSTARLESPVLGELLHLTGPLDAVLVVQAYEADGNCPAIARDFWLENFDQEEMRMGCRDWGFFLGMPVAEGHAMLSLPSTNAFPPRTYVVEWSVPRLPPFEAQGAADVPFNVTTARVEAPGLMLVERSPCGSAPGIRRVTPPGSAGVGVTPALTECGATAVMVTPAHYVIARNAPEDPVTWSVSMAQNPLAVPDQRPMLRSAVDGTYALAITAERAGRLHARITIAGAGCGQRVSGLTLFTDSDRAGDRINDCEQVIDVEAGQPVGVLIGAQPGQTLTGTISTWWE